MSLRDKNKSKKRRLDEILLERGLAETLPLAQSVIMSGNVFSGSKRLDKPGALISPETPIEIKTAEHPWVSRGGMKLEHAIKSFAIDVNEKICLDIGASTGGFTDVLLHHGARRVYAVDVGFGQIAWKLRQSERVTVLDKTNARRLDENMVPEKADIIVCDASFIRLENVLETPLKFAAERCVLIALVKPQFEVHKNEVGEGGIVRDPELHARVCRQAQAWLESKGGWHIKGLIESPIKGMEGNKEFLLVGSYNDVL